jgi:hypothetical protein
MLLNHLENRDKSFLRILERGIYANSQSPYRKLLLHAGLEFADVVSLVRQLGVEGMLARLWPAVSFLCL